MRMLGNKKNLLQEHLTKVSSKILSSSFRALLSISPRKNYKNILTCEKNLAEIM